MKPEENVLALAGEYHPMGLLDDLLRRGDGEDKYNRFFECRNCGTVVESATTVCPSCGATEVACYQL